MYSVRNSDVASVQLLNKGYYMENNNSVNFADYEFIPKLLTQIEKVIIGKHDVVKMLVAALLSGGHVLIEDVPGTGKTTLLNIIAGKEDYADVRNVMIMGGSRIAVRTA